MSSHGSIFASMTLGRCSKKNKHPRRQPIRSLVHIPNSRIQSCIFTSVCTRSAAASTTIESRQMLHLSHLDTPFGAVAEPCFSYAAVLHLHTDISVLHFKLAGYTAPQHCIFLYAQAWRDVQHSLKWLQEHESPAGVSGRAHRQQLLTALEHMVFFTTSDGFRPPKLCSSSDSNVSESAAGSFDSKQSPHSCSIAATSAAVNAEATAGQAKLVEQMLKLGAVPSLVALVRWQDQLHVHELVCQVTVTGR